jgi:hypothetical protein
MMKAIVTRQNADGSYDAVGMNNRRVTRTYFSEANLLRYGLRFCAGLWPKGTHIRVEIFRGDRIPSDPNTSPVKTIYATVEASL